MSAVHDAGFNGLMEALASIDRDNVYPQEINACLKQFTGKEVPAVQRALAARCLGYGPGYDVLETLIGCLADTDRRVIDEALTSIRQVVPWSGLSPWGVSDNPDHCFDTPLARVLEPLRYDKHKTRHILNQLARLEGATEEIGRALSAIDRGLAGQFKEVLALRKGRETQAQITLVPSYRCNLRCRYCYVIEKINQPQTEMSFQQFADIVYHAEALGCKRIGFSGGEPTIHPEFGAMLSLLQERGISSFFASNMLFQPGLTAHFDPAFLGAITAHLRPAAEYNKKSWRQFLGNLYATRQAGIQVFLRYSVMPNEQIDLHRIRDVCAKTGVNQVNIALAIPSAYGNNEHIDADALRHHAHEFVNTLRAIQRMGLKVGVSKPLPPCLLDSKDRRLMSKLPFALGSCSIWQVGNTYNVVVNPDGSIWPCIAVQEDFGRFSEYLCLQHLGDRAKQLLEESAARPLFEACASCDLFQLKRCQGACLAYKQD